jgi:hypothetical protein
MSAAGRFIVDSAGTGILPPAAAGPRMTISGSPAQVQGAVARSGAGLEKGAAFRGRPSLFPAGLDDAGEGLSALLRHSPVRTRKPIQDLPTTHKLTCMSNE